MAYRCNDRKLPHRATLEFVYAKHTGANGIDKVGI